MAAGRILFSVMVGFNLTLMIVTARIPRSDDYKARRALHSTRK